MAEIIEESFSEHSQDSQLGNAGEESTPVATTKTSNPEPDNMEVHHHPHSHGKKNFKTYLWEFVMLFLAVFCGFLAEYYLEHRIEKERGNQFIESFYEDLKTDTAKISFHTTFDQEKVNG